MSEEKSKNCKHQKYFNNQGANVQLPRHNYKTIKIKFVKKGSPGPESDISQRLVRNRIKVPASQVL